MREWPCGDRLECAWLLLRTCPRRGVDAAMVLGSAGIGGVTLTDASCACMIGAVAVRSAGRQSEEPAAEAKGERRSWPLARLVKCALRLFVPPWSRWINRVEHTIAQAVPLFLLPSGVFRPFFSSFPSHRGQSEMAGWARRCCCRHSQAAVTRRDRKGVCPVHLCLCEQAGWDRSDHSRQSAACPSVAN